MPEKILSYLPDKPLPTDAPVVYPTGIEKSQRVKTRTTPCGGYFTGSCVIQDTDTGATIWWGMSRNVEEWVSADDFTEGSLRGLKPKAPDGHFTSTGFRCVKDVATAERLKFPSQSSHYDML